MASMNLIRSWLQRGKLEGATHVIIVCDTYDWEDYPVYVTKSENVREIAKNYDENMQKVMEVYSLALDVEEQLNKHRVFNYD